MKQPKVYILSGPVQSGKTTALRQWVGSAEAQGKKVGGYLAPDLDGLRYLHLIKDSQWHALQTFSELAEEDRVSIGKFTFYASAFMQMRESLRAEAVGGCDWVVVDEYGKLEVKGKGVYSAVARLIEELNNLADVKVIIVVRESLVEQTIAQLKLSDFQVIGVDDLEFLS